MPNLATAYTRTLYSDPSSNDYPVREDQPLPVAQGGIRTTPDWRVTSAANAAGTVTVPAPTYPGEANQVSRLVWSYRSDPTGGNIVVMDGSTTLLDFDITSAGPGFIWFPTGWTITPQSALTLTIHAGGGTAVGKA